MGGSDDLAHVLNRLGRLTRTLQFAEGLNPAQWESLRFLGRANRFSRTPGALAAYLGTTRGTTSQTLLALERKGLVRRARGGRDRRVIVLDLTPAGRALLTRDPLVRLNGFLSERLSAAAARDTARQLARILAEAPLRLGLNDVGVCAQCGHFLAPADNGGRARCGYVNQPLDGPESERFCVNFARDPECEGQPRDTPAASLFRETRPKPLPG